MKNFEKTRLLTNLESSASITDFDKSTKYYVSEIEKIEHKDYILIFKSNQDREFIINYIYKPISENLISGYDCNDEVIEMLGLDKEFIKQEQVRLTKGGVRSKHFIATKIIQEEILDFITSQFESGNYTQKEYDRKWEDFEDKDIIIVAERLKDNIENLYGEDETLQNVIEQDIEHYYKLIACNYLLK